MFNAIQGFDALLGGFDEEMRQISEMNRRNAGVNRDISFEREYHNLYDNHLVPLINRTRAIIKQHNALVVRVNELEARLKRKDSLIDALFKELAAAKKGSLAVLSDSKI
ncbi:MAG: hypothetical protein Q7K57_52345 [Burkholderiaceae bacterium]|nr:hypothetical protein [Burkholderiaceae bacterium]